MEFLYKNIRIFEPQIKHVWFIHFQAGWQITQEKQEWDRNERILLEALSLMERKKKLPKWRKRINQAMAQSHRNQSASFMSRNPIARVVDIADILHHLGYKHIK